MNKYIIISVSLFSLIIYACNSSNSKKDPNALTEEEEITLLESAQNVFQALPNVAVNPENPLTPEKIELGKLLYFDTRLSLTGNNSCNSCHNLETFGVDNLPTSKGDNGKFGNRNSPTVFNAALHSMQFWDGRAKDVEEQAGGPIINPDEMAIPSKEYLVKKLSAIDLYKNMFAKAFPDDKNPITYDNVQKAIAAFERTLITPSIFDAYIKGDKSALNSEQKKGLKTFMESGCLACHAGANVGGMMMQKFGLMGDYRTYTKSINNDEGKKGLTKQDADKDIFKVPSLRNVTKTAPYFHDGSVSDLGEAIKIMAKLQSNKELNDEQVLSIIKFLETLTSDIPADTKKAPAVLTANN